MNTLKLGDKGGSFPPRWTLYQTPPTLPMPPPPPAPPTTRSKSSRGLPACEQNTSKGLLIIQTKPPRPRPSVYIPGDIKAPVPTSIGDEDRWWRGRLAVILLSLSRVTPSTWPTPPPASAVIIVMLINPLGPSPQRWRGVIINAPPLDLHTNFHSSQEQLDGAGVLSEALSRRILC